MNNMIGVHCCYSVETAHTRARLQPERLLVVYMDFFRHVDTSPKGTIPTTKQVDAVRLVMLTCHMLVAGAKSPRTGVLLSILRASESVHVLDSEPACVRN